MKEPYNRDLFSYSSGSSGIAYQPHYENSYAIIIGIDTYLYPTLRALGKAEEDARAMQGVLAGEPYKFEVDLLLGSQATKKAILAALKKVSDVSKPDDRIIFYFAGHGYLHRKRGFLACYDSNPEDFFNGLEYDHIIKLVEATDTKHIAFIFDACFSGKLFGLETRGVDMGDDILVYLQHKAYQALTAGAVEPVSDLHSMTGKLVKFLREGIPGHEPPLTFNDIAHHIQQTIHRETRGKQTPEFGNLLGSGKGQMVFLPPGKFKFYPEKPGIKNEPIPIQGELPQEPLETLIGKLVGIKFPEESPPKPREPVPILQQLPPPFVWCDIPKGEVTLEGGVGKFEIKPFKIAKYPITYGQFETFMTDSKGFNRLMWWDGLSEVKKMDHPQKWKVKGYPRENVSWFAAVAFCRWLSYQVGYEVRLPTEWEWQWAAQGPDGLVYPWGNEFDKTLANTREGVGGGFLGLMKWTTPVDQYPKGESPFGVGDMAGNVMEWCLNDYDNPTNTSTSGLSRRAVRGGSWRHNQDFARCARRDHLEPGNYNTHTGFRIASSST